MLRIGNLWIYAIAVCCLPLLWLVSDMIFGNLGANPIEQLHIRLGDWSLRFLGITLAITPIQTISKWRGMADYRQMFGLCAFFYASLHFIVYLWLDHGLQWSLIAVDIAESSYIWFGLLAYFILFSLAVTSPKLAKKRMGKNWKKLHRLIYLASAAAIWHYFWQLKGNLAEPLLYLLILILLLSFRVLVWFRNRRLSQLMIPNRRSSLLPDSD